VRRLRAAALGTALALGAAPAGAAPAAPPAAPAAPATPPKAAPAAAPRPLALGDAADKALRAERARRGLKPSAVEPQLDALRAADPWVALVRGAGRIGGAGAFAFVALDQAFARLGVPAAERLALADPDDASDQLTALGEQMHLFDDPALGIPEAWRASFAQLAIDLARARQRATEALAALPPAARAEIAAGMLPFAASGLPPRADDSAVDYGAMARAAGTLLLATDAFLEQLPRDEAPAFAWRTNVPGVTGFALGPFPTIAGPMYLGGIDANGWAVPRDAIVIDLGGPDLYGASAERYAPPPDAGLLVVIDLQGDDTYRPAAPGALAAGALGLSLLRDLGGNDSYEDRALGQGSAVFGVGVLLDEAGNDRYVLGSGGQGSACAGVGMLVDGAGDDLYLAGGLGQGAASGRGVGLLADLSGDDVYRATGEGVLGAAAAAAQGAGLRAAKEGARGTGILLDLAGDDVFLAARGAQGSASGGHGLLIDGGGNDFSSVGSDGQAGASGGGTAVLIDFGGDDVRVVRGAGGQAAADGGAAVLLDEGGTDQLRCGEATSCRGVARGDGRALFLDLGVKPSARVGLPPKPAAAAAPAKEGAK
jgi:hypothetical protein